MLADEGACCIIAYGAGVNECEIALYLPCVSPIRTNSGS